MNDSATATVEPAAIVNSGMWEALEKLNRDLRGASRLLGQREARYLVDSYYQIQNFRIAMSSQIRNAQGEPNRVLSWFLESMQMLERNIQRALGEFASEYTVGQWAQSICGIGPVISAGFLSHIDIRRAKTVGHIWRFAGLDPSVKWEKKTKRPWNAQLKVLCWKAGESFIKVKSNKNDFYGQYYDSRKKLELERNERGDNKETAAAILEAKKFNKSTEAYKHLSAGFLPPAQLHARARRFAVKLFLSHLHHVMFEDYYHATPPMPYAFEQLPAEDHRHYIDPPKWPMETQGRPICDLLKHDEPANEKE